MYELKRKFELKILSPTSFEIFETAEDNGFDISRAMVQYYKTTIDTRERCIREGLIALGWTPPQGTDL